MARCRWKCGFLGAAAAHEVVGAMLTADACTTDTSLPFAFKDLSGVPSPYFHLLAVDACTLGYIETVGGKLTVLLALGMATSPCISSSRVTREVVAGFRRIGSRGACISGTWPLACPRLVEGNVAQRRRRPRDKTGL
ncbi:hypothetical protein MRX96_040505 [Rhipicephalus microplus]